MKPLGPTWQELIPPEKHDAVRTALMSTFGTANINDATLLTGGTSPALNLKFRSGERAYVLRVILVVHAFNDPMRQFACLDRAAKAGISPSVYYMNALDGICISDFIVSQPLLSYPGSLLTAVADSVKRIHSLPLFPAFVNYLDTIDALIAQFQTSGLLPENATREHFHYYSQIQRIYPRHTPDLVSSHNDLTPRNILFDGDRLFVIDWEVAFRNDRYVDLANIANLLFQEDPETDGGEAEENTLLRAYFGSDLDRYKQARFYLMRPICHMFYAMALMLPAAGRNSGVTIDPGRETPGLREFSWNHFDPENDPLSSIEGQFLFGKIRFNEALDLMKRRKFAQAIHTISLTERRRR